MPFPIPEGEVLLDGSWVLASEARFDLADAGVQSGLGVFETVAVRHGVPLDGAEHVRRLVDGASRLAVPLPPFSEIEAGLKAVAARVVTGHGWAKIIATRGGRLAVFGGVSDPADEGRPAAAILLPWRRSPHDPLAGVKTLNYAPFVLGLEEARRRGADEALWRNTRGHLAEGCSSNLFVVRGRRVYTAAVREGILPGVTRALAIRAIGSLQLPVHEGKVRLDRLLRADEAFLTSSLRAVRPLVTIEGRPVGTGRPGPITRAVARFVADAREAGATSPLIAVDVEEEKG